MTHPLTPPLLEATRQDEVSSLDQPMARIATGWRIGYCKFADHWRFVVHAGSDSCPAVAKVGTAAEAKAEYMRLTSSVIGAARVKEKRT